jgi:hypothetical protein
MDLDLDPRKPCAKFYPKILTLSASNLGAKNTQKATFEHGWSTCSIWQKNNNRDLVCGNGSQMKAFCSSILNIDIIYSYLNIYEILLQIPPSFKAYPFPESTNQNQNYIDKISESFARKETF